MATQTNVAAGPSTLAQAAPISNKKLRGGRLYLARSAWLAIVTWTLALFAVAIPARQAELTNVLRNLSPAQELILREWGVSGEQHAGLVLLLEMSVAAGFLLMGLLIFWRKSNDWVAMLISAALVAYSAWLSPSFDSLVAVPGWRVAATGIQALSMILALAFFYVFPDGHFCPPWSKFMLGASVPLSVLWVLLPGSVFDLSNSFRLSLPSFFLMMVWLGTGVGAQVYRYTVVSKEVQRQQTKWILFGTTIAVVGYLVFGFDRFAVPLLAAPTYASIVYDLIGVPIYLVISLTIPISFAFSILRYRLWDINLVINRALVYAPLTAILAGLYTASITLSQRLFVTLTGERSDAAIVLTTLFVASAFSQVKGSLQGVVDRYVKSAPDPMKEVRAFRDRLLGFIEIVDVEQLTRKVLEEAVRSFDAAGGAVYLEQGGGPRLVHVVGEWTQVEGMSVLLESKNERYGWITLAPRRNGEGYAEEHYRLFTDIARLTTQCIRLARMGFLGVREQLEEEPVVRIRSEAA